MSNFIKTTIDELLTYRTPQAIVDIIFKEKIKSLIQPSRWYQRDGLKTKKTIMDYSKIDIQGAKIADEMYKDIENTVDRIYAKLAFYNGFINALKLVMQELKIAESKETE